MKPRTSLLFLMLCAISLSAFAQDIIYKTSGEEIKAKVLEISVTKILFKQPDLFADSIFSLPRQEVFMVKYANGQKELMTSPTDVPVPEEVQRTPLQMLRQGRTDAKMYYNSNKAIAGGAITGFLFFPAAIVVAAVPPKITAHDVPDKKLFANPHYYKGFRSQAHKKKLGKVAIGSGMGILGLILLSNISPGK